MPTTATMTATTTVTGSHRPLPFTPLKAFPPPPPLPPHDWLAVEEGREITPSALSRLSHPPTFARSATSSFTSPSPPNSSPPSSSLSPTSAPAPDTPSRAPSHPSAPHLSSPSPHSFTFSSKDVGCISPPPHHAPTSTIPFTVESSLTSPTRTPGTSFSLSSPTPPSSTHPTPTPIPPTPTPLDSLTRSTRLLQAGHVFTLHSLHRSTLTTRRVVLFLIARTLYACHYAPSTVRYRHPFLTLPLLPSTRVLLGKQTPALRLASAVPDRRCFAIEGGDGGVVELEAPGSGDVKYWLRGLWEVGVGVLGMEVGRTLLFVGKEEVGREVVERVERRLRQGRMEGQWARRREEGDRRLDAGARLRREREGEERAKEEEEEAKREEWAASRREAEQRVTSAALSPLREVREEQRRLAVEQRMEREKSAETAAEAARKAAVAAAEVDLPHASLAFAYADHNKRTASLQTHTTAPLLSHSPQSQGAERGRPIKAGHLHLPPSKSFPNLPVSASAPSSPSRFSAASSKAASPSYNLRRLGSVLPSSSTSSLSVSPEPTVPSSPSTPSPATPASVSPLSTAFRSVAALPVPPYVRASTTPTVYPSPVSPPPPALLPSPSPWSRGLVRPPPFLSALPITRVCAVQTPPVVLPASYAQPKLPSPMPTPLITTAADPFSPPSLVSPTASSSPSIDIHCHLDLSRQLFSPPPHIHFHLHTSTADSSPSIQPPSYSSLTFQPNALPTFLTSPTKR